MAQGTEKSRSKRNWSAIIRYTVCVLAVSWLVYHTNWVELKQVWIQADKRLIALGLLAFGPAPLLISIRLKWLLAVHRIHLSVWQAIKVTFAGNFIIWSLPVGTPGGDSVKAYYVARETPSKHEAVTTVFFDRLVGVACLVLMSGVVVLLNWHNPAFARWGQIIGLLVVGMTVGATVYFSYRLRKLFHLDRIIAMMPFSSHLQRIDRAVFAFRHSARRVAACFLLSWFLQIIAIVAIFLAGWALGMTSGKPLHDFLVYLAYTPICFLAGVLPIGVMEETFKQLFVDQAGFGTREAAYSLSLLDRFIQLVWALPGALVVLRARPSFDADQFTEQEEESAGPVTPSPERP